MNHTKSSEELPYQEAQFDGIEKHIAGVEKVPSNGKLGRRHFMDLLAATGGGISLTSLLASCGKSDDAASADPGTETDKTSEPVKIG